jgi:tetratricopeptide (TPR) repeat protein
LKDLDEALGTAEFIADTRCTAQTLCMLAEVYWYLGRLDDAEEIGQRALELARAIGDQLDAGVALRDLGSVAAARGDLDVAAARFEEALGLLAVYHHWGEAHGQARLGDVRRRQRRLAEALDLQQRAVAHFRRTHDPNSECSTLNHLGRTRHDLGEYEVALAVFERALELALATGLRYEELAAREGLSRACAALGRPAEALHQRELAGAVRCELTDARSSAV